MELSEKTKKYIETVKAQLSEDGVMTETDEQNLNFLAEAVELYYRGLDELDRTGLVVTDNKNRVVANPAFSIVRSSQGTITALMKELSVSLRQRRMLKKDNMVNEESPISQLFDMMQ